MCFEKQIKKKTNSAKIFNSEDNQEEKNLIENQQKEILKFKRNLDEDLNKKPTVIISP